MSVDESYRKICLVGYNTFLKSVLDLV